MPSRACNGVREAPPSILLAVIHHSAYSPTKAVRPTRRATGVCRPYPHRRRPASCGKAGSDHCQKDRPSRRTRWATTPRRRLARSSVRTQYPAARASSCSSFAGRGPPASAANSHSSAVGRSGPSLWDVDRHSSSAVASHSPSQCSRGRPASSASRQASAGADDADPGLFTTKTQRTQRKTDSADQKHWPNQSVHRLNQ